MAAARWDVTKNPVGVRQRQPYGTASSRSRPGRCSWRYTLPDPSFCGHQVVREFYINDAGLQIKVLGESIWARMKQKEDPAYFPETVIMVNT